MKLAANGPGTPPAHSMATTANTAYPFTAASIILDIGTGPGQIPSEIIKAYGADLPSSSRLVASDLSPGILEQLELRRKTEIESGNAIWEKVEPLICNATDLTAFQDNTVSHAFASFVLFMVPQARTALQEVRRVLTDQHGGGFFALSSWQGSEWMELMGFISKVRPEKTMPKMPPTWRTEDGVRAELEATGFRDINVYTVETYMPFDDYDEIARYILTQFPGMSRMTGDMTREDLEKVRDLMVEYIKSKHPVAPGRLTGTAIIGAGRK